MITLVNDNCETILQEMIDIYFNFGIFLGKQLEKNNLIELKCGDSYYNKLKEFQVNLEMKKKH